MSPQMFCHRNQENQIVTNLWMNHFGEVDFNAVGETA